MILEQSLNMREASFYEKKKDFVKCTACKHYCNIKENSYGVCGSRKNVKGKLFSLNYAKPVSISLDPIEKKPLYHFLPGSRTLSLGFLGCNFRCAFCQNYEISTKKGEEAELLLEKNNPITPQKAVDYALEREAKSIAFTYNEPVITIEYCLDVMKIASEKGIKSVFVSNGYASEETIKALKNKLDAINIDLKAFNEEFYKKICGAKLENVIETIKSFKKMNTWIEITTLLIPNKNDSEEELKELASFIAGLDKKIPWHISAFTPMYKMNYLESTPLKTMEKASEIGKEAGLKNVYTGNIRGEGNTYCACGALLIERNGFSSFVKKLKKGKCEECGKKIAGVF